MQSELICGICRHPAGEAARGWRGSLASDFNQPDEVLIMCPDCASRAFDDEPPRPTGVNQFEP